MLKTLIESQNVWTAVAVWLALLIVVRRGEF